MAVAKTGKLGRTRSYSFDFFPPHMSELRTVLLGNSWSQTALVGNLLLGKTEFTQHYKCVKGSETIKDKKLTVINAPDLLHSTTTPSTSQQLHQIIQDIKTLSAPGPHVFLLVLQPEDFTEQHKTRLESVLESFSEQAFQHSLVLICSPREQRPGFMEKYMSEPHIRDMIIKCRYRYLLQKNLEFEELLTRVGQIVKENNGEHISQELSQDEDKGLSMAPVLKKKSSLNLVLCGRRLPVKSSVVESVLGSAAPPTASSPGQCVRQQGEVCGRWVSLVELPALSGKPLEAVMQQCLSCISLCGPEGVHAFILVLPVGPLTDEDKAELKTIQDTFSSAVNLHTMILFTVDSDHTDPAVDVEEDVQKFCQGFGGGHLIFNTRGQQQVSELLDSVETLRAKNKPHSYTTETLQQAHIEKINFLYKELQDTKTKGSKRSESLRIALIGKTGTGKSSSGNTILGREEFYTKLSQKPVTKVCQRAESGIDGRHVAVVDTPGLFDTTMSQDEDNVERLKCISLLAPGPHVFLLVLQIGRFTEEEKKTLEHIRKGFGKNAERFTIILLTHGDKLENNSISIEEYISEECDDAFKKVMAECGNRFHVFNNCDVENRAQVKELMKKIDEMLKENRDSCYTNDMLLEAEAAIKKEMRLAMKKKEEEMRRERGEIERKYQDEMTGIKVRLSLQKEEIDRERRQKELADRKMKESKKQMDREREQWEKERKEWLTKSKQDEDELRKLQDKYQQEKDKNLRLEREQEEREKKEDYRKQVEQMKSVYDFETGKQAEEFHKLKDLLLENVESLTDQYVKEVQCLKLHYQEREEQTRREKVKIEGRMKERLNQMEEERQQRRQQLDDKVEKIQSAQKL